MATPPRRIATTAALTSRAGAIPAPHRDPRANQVVFAGFKPDILTCLLELRNLKTSNHVDITHPLGMDGGTVRHGGRKLATFEIHLRAWHEEGFLVLNTIMLAAFDQPDVLASVLPGAVPPAELIAQLEGVSLDMAEKFREARQTERYLPRAYPIFHPQLAARRITACYVTEIDGPHYENGFLIGTLSCVQYGPPPPEQKKGKDVASGEVFGPIHDTFLEQDKKKHPPKPLPPSAGKKPL